MTNLIVAFGNFAKAPKHQLFSLKTNMSYLQTRHFSAKSKPKFRGTYLLSLSSAHYRLCLHATPFRNMSGQSLVNFSKSGALSSPPPPVETTSLTFHMAFPFAYSSPMSYIPDSFVSLQKVNRTAFYINKIRNIL